ncbi:MAG: C40 family peptidase [Clostridia bacterium]|nr:C40 family peptidase [Clostridia bacterium]
MTNYAELHPEYDECKFNLDTIWHDPYSLISFLSALHDGQPWTIDDVTDDMISIFERQYTLTETVHRKTKYRTETRTGVREVVDEETGMVYEEVYEYEISVPYTYTTCTVTLDNFNLSHLPILSMSKEKVGLYALYMSTLGNMPDLFSRNPYASTLKDPFIYDIPEEYFADENFARLIEEGEKYLGFPYVWGGTSPSTSFDCCGFVSFVLTNSGVLNTGPRGVEGLYDLTDRIQPSEARPGDLVFFSETYEGGGVLSHVGLYVGDGYMLHCGNPIGYVHIESSFYRDHFYAFGRLPI